MAETKQDLNEAGVEAAAKTMYENDREQMGPLADALFPQAQDWETLPEDFRAMYVAQVRPFLAAYFEAASA